VVLDRDRELQRMKEDLTRLERRVERNRQNSEDSDTPEERRDYVQGARKNATAAAQLRGQISTLQARPANQLLMPADARVGRVVMAIATLARPGPAEDMAEALAVRQVFRDRCMPVDGLLIYPTFVVAAPTNDRLMLLGPVSFTLPNRSRNGAAVLLQRAPFTPRTMAPAFRSRVERQRLVARLSEGPTCLPPRPPRRPRAPTSAP
jgi:hypothetical protein